MIPALHKRVLLELPAVEEKYVICRICLGLGELYTQKTLHEGARVPNIKWGMGENT